MAAMLSEGNNIVSPNLILDLYFLPSKAQLFDLSSKESRAEFEAKREEELS